MPLTEQRRHIRLQPWENTVAVWRDATRNGFGRVLDLSRGGLGFGAFAAGSEPRGRIVIDLINTRANFQLQEIPVALVAATKPSDPQSAEQPQIKYGFQFIGMNEDQAEGLDHFIHHHTRLDSFWTSGWRKE